MNLQKFLEELEVSNIKKILEEVEYFTEKEAEERDQIVVGYFGRRGIERIVDSIVRNLLSPPKLKKKADIVDVGCGSGLFTIRVANRLRQYLPEASFYAMDVTPAMLQVLRSKSAEITPFLGVADNISGSIRYARRYLRIPEKFDAIFSTLMLHHCPEVEKVFKSMREVLRTPGKVVLVDLCKHPIKEFAKEICDVHLGFDLAFVKSASERYFSEVKVMRIPGTCCKSSGRSVDLFVAVMTNT